jgi:hypothetical protein
MTTFTLIIDGRDTWSDTTLDRIEQAVRGRITHHKEDGRGGMRFYARPNVRTTKPMRKEILAAVLAVVPDARWVEV